VWFVGRGFTFRLSRVLRPDFGPPFEGSSSEQGTDVTSMQLPSRPRPAGVRTDNGAGIIAIA